MGTKELRNRDPNFNEIGTPPRNFFFRKCYKLCFLLKKTPDFGPKNRLRIWGVLPSPLYGFFFQQKGTYGFGGSPRPPFTDKIRKVVFDRLPKNDFYQNCYAKDPSGLRRSRCLTVTLPDTSIWWTSSPPAAIPPAIIFLITIFTNPPSYNLFHLRLAGPRRILIIIIIIINMARDFIMNLT